MLCWFDRLQSYTTFAFSLYSILFYFLHLYLYCTRYDIQNFDLRCMCRKLLIHKLVRCQSYLISWGWEDDDYPSSFSLSCWFYADSIGFSPIRYLHFHFIYLYLYYMYMIWYLQIISTLLIDYFCPMTILYSMSLIFHRVLYIFQLNKKYMIKKI